MRSCLKKCLEQVTKRIDEGSPVDIIDLDFQKTLHKRNKQFIPVESNLGLI